MFVGHEKEITSVKVAVPEARNATKKSLVGPSEGWDGWVMRSFTLGRDGYTPRHRHAWPHINYVLSGKGIVILDSEQRVVERGTVAYIPGEVEHQFRNTGGDDLVFICIVPQEGDI